MSKVQSLLDLIESDFDNDEIIALIKRLSISGYKNAKTMIKRNSGGGHYADLGHGFRLTVGYTTRGPGRIVFMVGLPNQRQTEIPDNKSIQDLLKSLIAKHFKDSSRNKK